MKLIKNIKIVNALTGEAICMNIDDIGLWGEWGIVEYDKEHNIMFICQESEYYLYKAFTQGKKNKTIYFSDFLSSYCSAHGGDWVGMLFSGMKRAFPEVWDAVPEYKQFTFKEVCDLLELCGVVFD